MYLCIRIVCEDPALTTVLAPVLLVDDLTEINLPFLADGFPVRTYLLGIFAYSISFLLRYPIFMLQVNVVMQVTCQLHCIARAILRNGNYSN